ncbi:MAG: SpoIIE family protein phosphatase [Bryobacteraceae bacterium]|nr:SpoIIE family protein phosphatase [Bryobacteraceae bacterium]
MSGPEIPPAAGPASITDLRQHLLTRLANSNLEDLFRVRILSRTETPPDDAALSVSDRGTTLVVESVGAADAMHRALLRSWQELFEAGQREEQLLEELAINWESLQALYDLSGDLQAGLGKDEVLHRILQRAVAGVKEGSALLLLTRNGQLTPIAGFNAELPTTMPSDGGLMQAVVTGQQAIVLSGSTRIAERCSPEAVWAGAYGLAMAPIVGPRRGLFGMIVVWSFDSRARFNSHLIRLLEALGHQSALILESDRLTRTLRESERLRSEVQIGSLIQQMLLMSEAPRRHQRFDVGVVNMASQAVDGDFVDLYAGEDGRLEVVVGDVMGKGIPAALIGAATKTHLLRSTAELRCLPGGQDGVLAEVVNRTAQRMTARLMALERFVTLAIVQLDPEARVVRWVDCGHPAILHYCASTGTVATLKGEGLPLGVLESEVYTEMSRPLQPGDALLFYSDGVTEAANAEGEMFGEQRLADLLAARAAESTAAILTEVRTAIIAFTGKQRFADDFTCIAVRFLPEGEWPVHSSTLRIPAVLDKLGEFHNWCEEFLRGPESDMDSDTADLVHLALTEALTNAIRHSCEENPARSVQIYAVSCKDGWIFEIEDDGVEWEGTVEAEPAFDGSKSGGFGLFILEQVMDQRAVTRLAQGLNRLILKRYRNRIETGNSL